MDGDDLVEIGKSDAAGHRGSSLAHCRAGARAKRGDLAIRSRSNRICAHRDASQRSLCVVPHQRALQDHAARLLWLPQWHDSSRRGIGAFTSGDDELLRRLPPNDDVARLSIHRPCPGTRAVRQLPQQQDRSRQDAEPPHHQRSLQYLSFQYGHVQGRDTADQYAASPRSGRDDDQAGRDNAHPAGNSHGASQHRFVKAAKCSNITRHAQRLAKTEPCGSRQRLRDLPQRRRRNW